MNSRLLTFAFFSTVFIFFISCRSGGEDVQEIDQELKIYVDSAGIDLLDKNLPLAYKTILFNDINGITDIAPVSYAILQNKEKVNYMQYIAGARRILVDSSDVNRKLYQSKIAIRYSKPISPTKNYVVDDMMTVNYSFTPQSFKIENVLYNNVQVFTKGTSSENVVKIQK